MSIIIKGLDMPKSCGQCNLRAFDDMDVEYCVVTASNINKHTKRKTNCPLVEIPSPHGRLIDGDELAERIRDVSPDYWTKVLGVEAEDIADAPTILEAEE